MHRVFGLRKSLLPTFLFHHSGCSEIEVQSAAEAKVLGLFSGAQGNVSVGHIFKVHCDNP